MLNGLIKFKFKPTIHSFITLFELFLTRKETSTLLTTPTLYIKSNKNDKTDVGFMSK